MTTEYYIFSFMSRVHNKSKKNIKVRLLFIMLFFSMMLFVRPPVVHAIPVEDFLAVPQRVGKFILDKLAQAADFVVQESKVVLEYVRDAEDEAWAIAYKAALKNFLNKVAYDTGTWLGSGSKGQQPMFITEGWGEYLKNAGDAAAGIYIETLATEWSKAESEHEGTIPEDSKKQLVDLQDKIKLKEKECNASLEDYQTFGGDVFGEQSEQCVNELILLKGREGAMLNVIKDIKKAVVKRQAGSILQNICKPDLQVQMRITAGLQKGSTFSSPRCTLSKIIDNWEDEINDPNFLNKFQANFNPWENDLGIALTVHTNVLTDKELEKKLKELGRLESSGVSPVTDIITGSVVTPGKFVVELFGGTIKDSTGAEKTTTGSIVADAVDIFAQSLAGNLLEQWFKKGIASLQGSGSSGSSSGATAGLYNPSSSSFGGGIKGAEIRFAKLGKSQTKAGGPYELLRELTVCRDEENPGPNDCIITESFREAIEREFTIKEAIDEGLLDDSITLGFSADGFEPNYKEGYPYRSLIVLRKHRIIPVGWELAALYIKDIGHEQQNLRQLINNFENSASPFRGMIDPNWVLKAPEAYCGKKGSGPVILSERVVTGVDQNQDGDFDDPDDTPPTRVIGRDANYCADERSCIKERQDGTCEFYGYCTEERRGWDYGVDSQICEPRNQTCQTFEDKNGNDVSYLQDTLTFTDCSIDNAGCAWYCTDIDIATGEFTCTDSATDQRRYLDRDAQECDEDDVGCSELIRITKGTNLIKQPSFETDSNSDGLADGWGVGFGGATPAGGLGDHTIDTTTSVSGGKSQMIEIINPDLLLPDGKIGDLGLSNSYIPGSDIFITPTEHIYTLSGYGKIGGTIVAGEDSWQIGIRTNFSGFNAASCGALGYVWAGGTGECYFDYFSKGTRGRDGMTNTDFQRQSVVANMPPQLISSLIRVSVMVRGIRSAGAQMWVDAVQFEIGDTTTAYSDYGTKNVIHEKVAPDYLNCQGFTSNNPGPAIGGVSEADCTEDGQFWFEDGIASECRQIDKVACGNYALSCFEDEVGCQGYTPKSGGPTVPGVVGENDTCSAECVGYDTFQQEVSYFEQDPVFPLFFIPATGDKCSAKEAGCTEFTNLDRLAAVNADGDVEYAPEAIEYFTKLRQCVLVDEFGQANPAQLDSALGETCETFFSWIGSDETGYQLISEELKSVAVLGGFDPVGTGGPLTGCNSEGDALADPNCREFFDDGGNARYKFFDTTFSCTTDCHPYRMTRSAVLDNATQDINCTTTGGEWRDQLCEAGTVGLGCNIDSDCDTSVGSGDGVCGPIGTGSCIYHAVPGQGETCSERAKNCREYSGNAARNTRTLFTDTFENESDIRQYAGSDIAVSSESTNLGGHSQKVQDAGGTTNTRRSVSKLALIIEGPDTNWTGIGSPNQWDTIHLPYWEELFGNLGYQVIDLSVDDDDNGLIDFVEGGGVVDYTTITGYQPDIVLAIKDAWPITQGPLLEQLYNVGYSMFTQGNDTTAADILPIVSGNILIADEPVIYSTNNHFIARGWKTSSGSFADNRYRIEEVHPAAVVIAEERQPGERYPEALYLAESGKGRWYHHQPHIYPLNRRINQTLFSNAIQALDTRAGEAIQQDKAYKLSFWAKGTGDMTVNFSGAALAAGQYFADTDITTRPPLIHLIQDWRQYTLGPIPVNWAIDPQETLNFTTDAATNLGLPFFIDNVRLTEVKENIYMIAGSWNTPSSCDATPAGDPWPQYALGCEAYTDTRGAAHNLKSFSNLCREEAIGCEAMIDTHNSDNPFAENFNTTNVPTIDDVNVSADNIVYVINDPNKYCNPEGQACRLLGLPQFDLENILTGFEATYLRDDPDTYPTALCVAEELWCEEYFYEGGLSYFKDPKLHTCEWKDGIGGQSGWFKRGSVAGAPDCPITSRMGYNGQTIQQPAGGWAGFCPADESGCTQYMDPMSLFNPNTLFNGDFEQDANGDGVPDGWVDGGSALLGYTSGSGIQSSFGVNAEISGGGNICQGIILEPNTMYEVSAFVKNGLDGNSPRIMIDSARTGQWGVCTDNGGDPANAETIPGRPGETVDRCGPSSDCQLNGGINGKCTPPSDPSVVNTFDCFAHSECNFDPGGGAPIIPGRCDIPACNYNPDPLYGITLGVCTESAVCPSGLTSSDQSMALSNDELTVLGLTGPADEVNTWFNWDYISNKFQRFSGRFYSGQGGNPSLCFGADHGGSPALGTGHIFDNIELRKVNIDYLVNSTLDKTSCNGVVDFDNGCVLLNEATKAASLTQVQYDPDHNFSSNTGKPEEGTGWVVCEPGAISACEANTLVKVRPDRSCGEWLYCETLSQSENAQGVVENQCYGIGLCNELDENGKCTGVVQRESAPSNELNNPADIADLTGYSLPGYNWGGGESVAGYVPLHQAVQRGNTGRVSNGSFEEFDKTNNKPYGWSGGDNYRVLNNPLDFEKNGFTKAPDGNNVLKVSGLDEVISDTIDVVEGEYYLQVDADTSQALETNTLKISVTGSATSIQLKGSKTWNTHIVDITIPPGSASIVIENNTAESTIFVDNIRLRPVLDAVTPKSAVEVDRLTGASCRLYPTADAPSCSYRDVVGKGYKGDLGYCLQWDTKNSDVCQMWWPVDVVQGDIGTFNAGYSGRAPLYYCMDGETREENVFQLEQTFNLNDADDGRRGASQTGYISLDDLGISEDSYLRELLKQGTITRIEIGGAYNGGWNGTEYTGGNSWKGNLVGDTSRSGINSWCSSTDGWNDAGDCPDWYFFHVGGGLNCETADEVCESKISTVNKHRGALVHDDLTLSTRLRDLAYCNQDRCNNVTGCLDSGYGLQNPDGLADTTTNPDGTQKFEQYDCSGYLRSVGGGENSGSDDAMADNWNIMAVFDNVDEYFRGFMYTVIWDKSGDGNRINTMDTINIYANIGTCNTLSKVVTLSGEGKPWNARTQQGSNFAFTAAPPSPSLLADYFRSDFDALPAPIINPVNYTSDYAPFGSVVPPSVSIDRPEEWDGSQELGKQRLQVVPPNTTDFSSPYQTRAGNPYDCSDENCDDVAPPPAPLDFTIPVQRLQQLFVKSYGAWTWEGICVNPGNEGLSCTVDVGCNVVDAAGAVTEDGICDDQHYRSVDALFPAIPKWSPPIAECAVPNPVPPFIPPTIIADHNAIDLVNLYCGVRPQVRQGRCSIGLNECNDPGDCVAPGEDVCEEYSFKINNNTGMGVDSLVRINVSGYVTLSFNTDIDPQQLPIKTYIINWGDGTYTTVAGLSSLQKADTDNPETFQHFYNYWDILDKQNQGELPPGTCAGNTCTFKPKIQIHDNWGWCTGVGDLGDPPMCGWDEFAGTVEVQGL